MPLSHYYRPLLNTINTNKKYQDVGTINVFPSSRIHNLIIKKPYQSIDL